jgi:DNA-binding transcriptional LysR family regulator
VHDIAVAACRQAGFEPRVFYASIHLESIFGLVASNIGIAMMMEQLYEYYKNDDIVAVPLEEVIPSNIVLAHLKSKKLPKPAKLFMDFIARTGA